jgi:hypothetical protein
MYVGTVPTNQPTYTTYSMNLAYLTYLRTLGILWRGSCRRVELELELSR